MKLHFLGANRQVTGSRTCIDSGRLQVLVDCGLVQERPYLDRNWDPCPLPPHEVDALLLTHVHIDHSGLIPKLVRDGFRGPIYTTRASAELLEVMLRDAAKIQAEDVAYKQKRHRREGRKGGAHPPTALFTDADVDQTLPLVEVVQYGKPVTIGDHISATFFDAGHVLGSAMIEVVVNEEGRSSKILFSGDIGQWHKPLIRDPTMFEQADYIVMESTYGDREHEDCGAVETQLAQAINRTVDRGGKVIIPTFALERAQELMYYISRLVRAKQIPDLKVFMDSPMAVDVTEIYRSMGDFFDAETLAMMAAGRPPLRFPGLTMTRSVNESRAINQYRQPCIVMASSGMCNAGRIKHHLRQNIGNSKNMILFVGYQGRGTLGRQILDGDPVVRIHGEDHAVRAEIAQICGFSGHADRSALLAWLGNLKSPPRHIFLNHGEEDVALRFAEQIQRDLKFSVTVPKYREVVTL